ncbi:MAG: hypothetical protein PGMFKBFP_00913 [Anaerolineales bacterium]|nr:hypothetical protein [Anaerolineales bacterium]
MLVAEDHLSVQHLLRLIGPFADEGGFVFHQLSADDHRLRDLVGGDLRHLVEVRVLLRPPSAFEIVIQRHLLARFGRPLIGDDAIPEGQRLPAPGDVFGVLPRRKRRDNVFRRALRLRGHLQLVRARH